MNVGIEKSRLTKKKFWKFEHKYNKNQGCQKKIKQRYNKNQGYQEKIEDSYKKIKDA